MRYEELGAREVKSTSKPHTCEWCGERMAVGSHAYNRVYKWKREFISGYMHMECYEAMLEVGPEELAEGWTPGDYARGSREYKGQ